MRKTIILATVMLLAISASADRRTIKDRTPEWLQRDNTEKTSGNLRGAIGETENPNDAGTLDVNGPIGEVPALAILILGGVYFIVCNKKHIIKNK
ncbi:MAG: hypothetical protein LBS25_02105 [Candidatus Symbiothrix sp.]|jgi:hypothetical protein|nr:hypothetical protein [Candidatus Symbiothrix sp.]